MSKYLNSDDVLREISEELKLEFVPKLFTCLAENPDVLYSTWNLVRSVLLRGQVDRLTKEMIFVITANEKNCDYCGIAHLTLAKHLGLSPALAKGLGSSIKLVEPQSLRNILIFAQKLASNDLGGTKKAKKILIDSGYSSDYIQEIVLSVGTASLMSSIANGLVLNDKIDEKFASSLLYY
jgi:AhpD family alkylhydroperoxidase